MPADPAPLDRLLRPRSIAIVGVSRDSGRQTTINGSAVLDSLLRFGYRGRIDLVHPEAKEIAGRPAYPTIAALPEVPDLLVIALPADRIPATVEAAGARGIRAAVVMAAGFSELGEGDGARLEDELRQAAARHGVRVCGPNGLGYINVAAGVCAGYFPCLASVIPEAGGLGIITHSGAVGNSLLARAIDRGVGTSLVISAGNETNVALADYVDDLVDDAHTRAIAIYMEGVVDGRALRQALARATAAGKQVVVYKVGKSPAGARAALSHTAKLAGEPALYGGLFRQLGVVEAARLDDLIEIPMLFLKTAPSPRPAPRNIGVVTISGGLGAIVADHFAAEGFALPALGEHTRRRLLSLPLKFGSVANPVDTTAAIQRTESTLADILTIVAEDPDVDALVFPNASRFPQRALDVANLMADTAARIDKPLVSVWYAGADNHPAMARLHQSARVACYDDPAAAARALAGLRLSQGSAARARGGLPAPPPGARARALQIAGPGGSLSEPRAKAILAAYGIAVPREATARSGAEAAACAASIGFPVAMKIVSAAIPHKARVGGVCLNLGSAAEVA
ncbi:MAG: acetate--CoA ligase family protein, partial [Burkholderiales bacterium]|nr:acetate--CoA ligase family protein [Burkholderiales bacterium]